MAVDRCRHSHSVHSSQFKCIEKPWAKGGGDVVESFPFTSSRRSIYIHILALASLPCWPGITRWFGRGMTPGIWMSRLTLNWSEFWSTNLAFSVSLTSFFFNVAKWRIRYIETSYFRTLIGNRANGVDVDRSVTFCLRPCFLRRQETPAAAGIVANKSSHTCCRYRCWYWKAGVSALIVHHRDRCDSDGQRQL